MAGRFAWFNKFYLYAAQSLYQYFMFFCVCGIALSICVYQASANETCLQQPSCADLGYALSISADCPSEQILLCPFDTNYKKCVIPSCGLLGFTTSDKSAWCNNIINCPRDNSYTACTNAKIADCSAYQLSSCPANGACTACGNGTNIAYKLDSCTNGYKISGTSKCVAKSCSDYGYITMLSKVCKNRYSVLMGSSSGYCYSNCETCENLGYNNLNALCLKNPKGCYKAATTNVSGYSYGTCTQYTIRSFNPPCNATDVVCMGGGVKL